MLNVYYNKTMNIELKCYLKIKNVNYPIDLFNLIDDKNLVLITDADKKEGHHFTFD